MPLRSITPDQRLDLARASGHIVLCVHTRRPRSGARELFERQLDRVRASPITAAAVVKVHGCTISSTFVTQTVRPSKIILRKMEIEKSRVGGVRGQSVLPRAGHEQLHAHDERRSQR